MKKKIFEFIVEPYKKGEIEQTIFSHRNDMSPLTNFRKRLRLNTVLAEEDLKFAKAFQNLKENDKIKITIEETSNVKRRK